LTNLIFYTEIKTKFIECRTKVDTDLCFPDFLSVRTSDYNKIKHLGHYITDQ